MSGYDPPTDSSELFDYDPDAGRCDHDDVPWICCHCAGPHGEDFRAFKADGRWWAICRPCDREIEHEVLAEDAADSAIDHAAAMELV